MPDVKTLYRLVSLRAPRTMMLVASSGLFAILQACSSAPKPFQPDLFSTTASPYAHSFVANNAQACEAARRAMLSQGYTTTAATADAVDANKGFQPSPEVHVVVSFHVVCTPSEAANGSSTLYVNAVQDNYGLKKSDTSATVGLSILGSVSLPIRSNNDSMVKFSSQTIPPGAFYDRFFALVDHYLKTVVRSTPVGNDASVAESPLAPLPTPAAVLSRSAPPIPVEVGASAPASSDNASSLPPLAASASAASASAASAPAASAPAASGPAPGVAASSATATSAPVAASESKSAKLHAAKASPTAPAPAPAATGATGATTGASASGASAVTAASSPTTASSASAASAASSATAASAATSTAP